MKRNQFIFGIIVIILGLLIAVGPHTLFAVCGPMEDGKFMKCHWTAQAESGIGFAILAAGIVSLLFKNEILRIGIYLVIAIQSIVVLLIPNILIGVCGKEHMRCRALTLPALNVLGIVTLLIGIGGSIWLWKSVFLHSNESENRKEQYTS